MMFFCVLCGGYELLDMFEEQLGINTGETSSDGNWTFSEVECLASCGTAPMFQVMYSDGEIDYFEDLGDLDRLEVVLSEFNVKLVLLFDFCKMYDERRN